MLLHDQEGSDPSRVDELRLIVLSMVAAGLCRGITPSPDAIHLIVYLGLWSVCVDADAHIFRHENRAEVEEYELKLREKEAKRAAYANLVGPSSPESSKAAPAAMRQSKPQRLCAPLAAYAAWNFLCDLYTR